MKIVLAHIMLIVLALSMFTVGRAQIADSADLFVLKRSAAGYRIDRLPIATGQPLTLNFEEDPEVIDIVLPVGPGGSGNLVQGGRIRSFTARFDGRSVILDYEFANGERQSFPARDLTDLRGFDSHVSVTGGDGSSARFIIRGYSNVRIDSIGPVMDMFGGRIPMQKGDYSIFINTELTAPRYALTGEIPLVYSGKYLFADVVSPDGRHGQFVVDIGASTSMLTEAFLPDSAEMSEVFMMEYSAGGTRKLKYAPGGATGNVENVIGTATLQAMTIGGLVFKQAEFDVIKSLPLLHDRQVDGIIGLDLLRAARFLTLRYNSGTEGTASLLLSNTPPAQNNLIQLPFVSIRRLMYVRGQIDSRPVLFILDSGAPDCMLQPQAAETLTKVIFLDSTLTFQGGGGQSKEGKLGTIQLLSLAGASFIDIPCVIGELSIYSTLGRGQLAGIIGNSLLSRFAMVSIDFQENIISLAHLN